MSSDPFRLKKAKDDYLPSFSTLDIGGEVSLFIHEYPIWMIYVRRDLRFPCTACYDIRRKSTSNSRCPNCFSTGYNVVFERQEVRLVKHQVPPNQGRQGIIASDPGFLGNYGTAVYVPRIYKPNIKKRGDLYLEVDWTSSIKDIPRIGYPASLITAYEVQMAVVFRESQNSYYGCGCSTYEFDHEWLEEDLIGKPLLTPTVTAI
jgi:hypothetical protein